MSALCVYNKPVVHLQVVDVQAFRLNEGMQDFTDAVLRTNYIYNRRWGDAPLRFLACHMFLDVKHKTKQFCEVDYEHIGRVTATC